MTTTTTPKLVTGTRSGLAWVEEHGNVLSFHLAGMAPAELGKFATGAAILERAPSELAFPPP